jgi:hypothetical protein
LRPKSEYILEPDSKGTARKSFKTIIHPGVAVELSELRIVLRLSTKACSNISDTKTGAQSSLLKTIPSSATLLKAHRC